MNSDDILILSYNSTGNIEKVVFNSIYADKNAMSEKHHPIVPSMLQHMKVSFTYFDKIMFMSFDSAKDL